MEIVNIIFVLCRLMQLAMGRQKGREHCHGNQHSHKSQSALMQFN